MTRVYYTATARLDLIEIGGYIDADSPRNADVFIAKLEAKARKISLSPWIYTPRRSGAWSALNSTWRSSDFLPHRRRRY